MALSARQLAMARMIMGLGAQRGLAANRQRELAAAAYAESGLDPMSVNKSSGAAGLFQLLSSGYRTRAQQLGGLHNPRANTLAILGDYLNYWRQHPNAAPGEAGRDVERSGEGAGFYARPLSMIPGGGGIPSGAGPLPSGTAPTATMQGFDRAAFIRRVLQQRMAGRETNTGQMLMQARRQAIQQAALSRASANPAVSAGSTVAGTVAPFVASGKGSGRGLAEAFYDPLGSYDNGAFGGPIGHHGDHVHLSITNPETMLYAIRQAQRMGLRVGENPYVDPVDPVHVHGSFHYRNFPGLYNKRHLGEAIDVSGSPGSMGAYYKWATGNLR